MKENIEFKEEDYAIVCREVDKISGRVTSYEIKTKITGYLLTCLRLRSNLNPELKYFVLKRENLDLVIDSLKNCKSSRIPLSIEDLVVLLSLIE